MNFTSRRLAGAGAVAAAALAFGACGTGESGGGGGGGESAGSGQIQTGPGVDAASKTIRVGNLTALTGPIAVIGKPTEDAYNAYFKSLNDRGGIDGWKLELVSRDTQYIPANHVQAFNEIRGDIAMLSSTGAPTTRAIQQQLGQEKLVTQPISFDTVWGLDPALAPLGTPYALEAMNAIDFQVKERDGQDKQFGMIYQNDEFGEDGRRGFRAIVEDLGLEDAGQLPYKSGDTDFTAQVQRLKSEGADVVLCTCSAPSLASAVGTAASQGYKPTWIAQSLAFTPQLLSDDGTVRGKKTPVAAPLADTTFTAAFATPRSALEQAAGWDQLKADTEKYAPRQRKYLPYYVFAYAEAMVVEAVMRKAIQSGNLTRQGIFDAKNSLGEVDLKGLATNVTYSREQAPPSTGSAISDVQLNEEGFLQVVEQDYTSDTARSFDIKTLEDAS